MSREELFAFYKNRINQFTSSLDEVKKQINLKSNSRLFSAIGIFVIFYFSFSNDWLLLFLPILIVVFIILVRKHTSLSEHKIHLENMLLIQQNELKALDGDQSGFEKGAEFIETHHQYSHDLDIFGEGSLFQCINRSTSISGKKIIANRLSNPLKSIPEINKYQEAVKEVSTKTEFRHELQSIGMRVEETPMDRQQLREWLSKPSFLYGKKLYAISLIVLPIINILLVGLSIAIDNFYPFFLMFVLMQWAFLGLHLKKVNEFHLYISHKKNILDKYAQILKFINRNSFQSTLLTEIASTATLADKKVTAIAELVGAFDARLNWMTNFIVNSVLLYDLQCVYRLERWKEVNASSLDHWLDTIHEAELLCSFGTFAFNNPTFTYPLMNDERNLSTKSLCHPLISEEERVANDIDLHQKKSILIITGANMAGKSTFLRTIGVNVVLAQCGAPVCAAEFNCPLIAIRSGMRTADSLSDNQSYFYAELNRLKSIIDELKSGNQLLILLDEILKGTNSSDKQAGSIALVKQLVHYPSLVFIATHDLALGELEKEYPQKIRNFCFEPTIENDQLAFDYKLKPGLATKMNATFLMKKMGIIPG